MELRRTRYIPLCTPRKVTQYLKRSTNDSTRYLARTAATPMVVFIIFVRAGMGWDSFARTLTKSSGVQIFYWIWLRSSSNASVWNLGTLGMCPPNLFGIYTETRQHGCQRTHLPTRPLRHVNPTPKLAGTDNIKQPQLSFQRKAIEDFRTHKGARIAGCRTIRSSISVIHRTVSVLCVSSALYSAGPANRITLNRFDHQT